MAAGKLWQQRSLFVKTQNKDVEQKIQRKMFEGKIIQTLNIAPIHIIKQIFEYVRVEDDNS